MSLKFDLQEYIDAMVGGIKDFLSTLDANDILRIEEPAVVDWPPVPSKQQDRQRLEAAAVRAAFELARLKLEPHAAAAHFLKLIVISERAAAVGIERTRYLTGYNEATGKRALHAQTIERVIAMGLAAGLPKAAIFEQAGISRAQGFRYLKRMSSK